MLGIGVDYTASTMSLKTVWSSCICQSREYLFVSWWWNWLHWSQGLLRCVFIQVPLSHEHIMKVGFAIDLCQVLANLSQIWSHRHIIGLWHHFSEMVLLINTWDTYWLVASFFLTTPEILLPLNKFFLVSDLFVLNSFLLLQDNFLYFFLALSQFFFFKVAIKHGSIDATVELVRMESIAHTVGKLIKHLSVV